MYLVGALPIDEKMRGGIGNTVFLMKTACFNFELRISPNIFEKNSKWLQWYTQGLGGNWFMKNTWNQKSRGTVPLSSVMDLNFDTLFMTISMNMWSKDKWMFLQQFCLLLQNCVEVSHSWMKEFSLVNTSCSAQTRTGIGHLRKPPGVELIPCCRKPLRRTCTLHDPAQTQVWSEQVWLDTTFISQGSRSWGKLAVETWPLFRKDRDRGVN